ncbi:MAG: toll/interleukin-1 receptor domain-containing protein [Gammaproteobacteria bacterium]|nr:toll/interleukin-1 receptor domain-containing protein [Gammaproteobacteria bacterium]MBU1722826.1 toll/interleukin-1 receptor domain-containing protein [Gammaproteobacteria bacterium]MBU2005954.1 toll/interleukin-1 receptor domain-containing protein [Gammaproteobacteria bacterium]
MTKVFISYSHDSDAHRARVLDLSNRLRAGGIDSWIDQYEPAPPEGWPRKMDQGIREANYVLMICTETYLRRLQLEEEQGKGLGVAWEGSLIYNTLYRDRTLNQKFIPVIFEKSDSDFIPTILFGNSHYDLSQPRGYDHVYRHIRGELGAAKPPLGQPHFTRTIYSNSLPTVEGDLFGRKDELTLLDQAWANPQIHIFQFIASGGTGKTKLLKHWLDSNTDSIEALLAWSFYSQGSSEDKQVSATPFFTHAFSILQSDKTSFATEEEKGEHLAHLLRQRRCMLVLDGLEPLQHAGRGMRGEMKDRAIRQLLKSLAGEYNSLCIITTRIAVHELSDRRAHVISHDLQNLAPADGVSLLKSWQVHGSDKELEKAVHEYGCHALALHLLGNALHSYLNGDARKRDTLDELIGDYDDVERHAFKVMQAYQRWLVDEAGKPTAELQLLYLLSLFDHPIETEVLEVLWQAQIPALTAAIPLKAWKIAIRDLREKHHLLSAHEGRPDLLDCHPLIREYFGKQLKTHQPESWRLAHERLYEYYKALPEKLYGKFLPDTLEEMQPLFSAVAHGCAAGLHQQAIVEIIVKRVNREDGFIVNELNAFEDYLACLSNFFDFSWNIASKNLSHNAQYTVIGWTSFVLRAAGRLNEAAELAEKVFDQSVDSNMMEAAGMTANNLSEIYLLSGNIEKSIHFAQKSLDYSNYSEDKYYYMSFLATCADALLQYGNSDAATYLLSEADKIEREKFTDFPMWYSINNFRYCNVLLQQGQIDAALARSKFSLEISIENNWLLDIGLDTLNIGMSYLHQKNILEATHWLYQARATLRASGTMHHIPRCLLACAALHRQTCNFHYARQDLQEVFDIADGSGMRLHLTDYHLEMARLLLAEAGFDSTLTPLSASAQPAGSGATRCLSGVEGNMQQAQTHIEAAAKLINETGYHRRDKELEELQKHLETATSSSLSPA